MRHPFLEGSRLGAAGRTSSQQGLEKGRGCIEGFNLPEAASGPYQHIVGDDDDSHGELQEDSFSSAARCLHPVQCDQRLPASGQQQGRQEKQDIPPQHSPQPSGGRASNHGSRSIPGIRPSKSCHPAPSTRLSVPPWWTGCPRTCGRNSGRASSSRRRVTPAFPAIVHCWSVLPAHVGLVLRMIYEIYLQFSHNLTP